MKDIEADFNIVAGRLKRSVGQLKTLWRGLKAKSKKEVGDVKPARRKTGGGPPSDGNLSMHYYRKNASLLPTELQKLESV